MKKTLTWLLLLFVAATVVMQIFKTVRTVKETTFADGIHLVVFHATIRCPTCSTMERLVNQVLRDDFKTEVEQRVFDQLILDYESPENIRLVEEYKIATATVLLFEQRGGKYVRGKNLADLCWKLVGDEQAFRQMIKTQINVFLSGKGMESESQSEEILLDPELNLFDDETTTPSNERKQQ